MGSVVLLGDGSDCSVLAVERKDLYSSPRHPGSLSAGGIRDRQSPQSSSAATLTS